MTSRRGSPFSYHDLEDQAWNSEKVFADEIIHIRIGKSESGHLSGGGCIHTPSHMNRLTRLIKRDYMSIRLDHIEGKLTNLAFVLRIVYTWYRRQKISYFTNFEIVE